MLGVCADGYEAKRRYPEDLAMRYTTCVAFLVAWGAVRTAVADCGSIPFKPSIRIFEPTQRALIAFNGREQILILSTDLRALNSDQIAVREMVLFPLRGPTRSGPSRAIRERFSGIGHACRLPVGWDGQLVIGEIWPGSAPSTQGF